VTHTIDWLLKGDASIRWQVMRDLLEEPPEIYEKERVKIKSEGWGARLLSRQDANGTWGGGIYSPKWISTTYTLLLLRQLGLSQDNPQAQKGCEHFLLKGIYHDGGLNLFKSIDYSETCVNGMILTLLSYFHFPDERVHTVAEFLLKEQMPDGGWNCQRARGATHASFHTTISVLEGMYEYGRAHPKQASRIKRAIGRAHEFLLVHHLYKSHRTGEVIDSAMTRMHFPPRWHYDFLRALDFFQTIHADHDDQISDAIELLKSKQQPNGRWLAYRRWPGRVFFELEKAGEDSRWNTLRALRVLKWWEESRPS
jgi:prenyltransferase/squalene oxidase-like repeat protein